MKRVSEPPPSIPKCAAASKFISFDGTSTPGVRFYALKGPVTEGPAVLFGHANGFAAGSYLPWLQRLAERMRVFAYDLRGHGGSERVSAPFAEHCHVDAHARDLSAVAAHQMANGLGKQETQRLHYVAHSIAGLAALRLGAVQGAGDWQSVCLFEPPLSPTPDLPEHAGFSASVGDLIHVAERRRREWASPQAFYDRLDGNPHYAAWDRSMMRAHCKATLHAKQDDSGYELACDPLVEAANYRATLNSSTFRFVNRFSFPTTFVAGDLPGSAAHMQRLAADRVPGARFRHLVGTGHMMLFERPDECADVLFDHINHAGDAPSPF